ncbi:MAG: nuclear transport factor 2 family protein [Pseudonocardiales bacterium]|nr:nuclear transport factor 2 family protein [Pseudonocardiales bacterium]
MAKPASIDELRAAERRLQAAQLAGDTAALEQLLDDRVLFTSGSTGARYTKHDDLYLHRTREQILTT